MDTDRARTLEPPELQVERGTNGGQPGPARKSQLWLVILILCAVAAAAFFYFRSRGSSPPAATGAAGPTGMGMRAPGAIPVVATRVTKGNIGVYLAGLGSVVPIYTVTIKTQISGYLQQVLYKEGDMVQKGDLLAQIDPRPYQVMLEQAEAGLSRDEANLENSRVDLKRYETLAPLKAVPEQQLATQQASVKQFEATTKSDQAQIDAAKLDLTYCRIVAPITGRVGLRLIDPGNYVTPGDSTGLVVITQLQPSTVIFTLAEDQIPPVLQKLHSGAHLRVDVYGREGLESGKPKIAQGMLSTVDNQIDPATGSIKLRATFENRDSALFPNQFVNARLLVEEKLGVTLIPTAAVQRNSQMAYVYVVKPDSTVTIRPINIGTTEGGESEITSGVKPGDVVVMTGVERLLEGSKVRAQMYGEGTDLGLQPGAPGSKPANP